MAGPQTVFLNCVRENRQSSVTSDVPEISVLKNNQLPYSQDDTLFKITIHPECPEYMQLNEDQTECEPGPEMHLDMAHFNSLLKKPVYIDSVVNGLRLGLKPGYVIKGATVRNDAVSASPPESEYFGQTLQMNPIHTKRKYYD